jgi:hypothetical protein
MQREIIIALISGGLILISSLLIGFIKNGEITSKFLKFLVLILAHTVFVYASATFFAEESYMISFLLFVIALWCINPMFRSSFRT